MEVKLKDCEHSKTYSLLCGERAQEFFLLVLIVVLYFSGINANSIWTTHESYYAESVREMLEQGNFWDITFNYELRLNKPPLTYWLMAASASIFGLQEWSLRLPILLLGLGSIYLIYLLGRRLYNHQTGFLAMIMMAVSLQFVWLKHYASPEIPLTFFFTLTIYLFIRAFQLKHKQSFLLAYTSLGLTVLTKGYPYLIIIGGILAFYLLIQHDFSLKKVLRLIPQFHLPIGLLTTLGIGMSWVVVMYVRYPQEMMQTLAFETTARAFENSNLQGELRNLFFYPEVTLWSFLPFSLALFLVIFYYFKHSYKIKEVALSVSWLAVMLVIFTIAKGKLPAYFIEAHPAMALLLASFMIKHKAVRWKKLWNISFLLPAFLIIILGFLMVVLFQLPSGWYFVLTAALGLMLHKLTNLDWESLPYYGFYAMVLVLFIMFTGLYPALEKYRPYQEIDAIIKAENIDHNVPLIIEERFIHNLPYYSERKALRDKDYSYNDILQLGYKHEMLAMVKSEHQIIPSSYEVLWEGELYKKGSESHGFQFVLACWKAMTGDHQKFQKYKLIYKKEDSFTAIQLQE